MRNRSHHRWLITTIVAATVLLGAAGPAVAADPDTERPSAPTNVVYTVAGDTVTLSWDASTDNVGVTGYDVNVRMTDFVIEIHKVTTTTLTIDKGLERGKSYSTSVTARDAAGNIATSTSVLVKIPTDGPPPAKVGTPVVGAVTETTAALSWPEPADAAELRSYQVVHVTGDNRVVVATFDAADGPAGVVTGLRKNTGYNLVVRSQDVRGNYSPDSDPVKVVTTGGPDTEKPTAPTNLVATQTSPFIALSWDASTDNVGVVSYTVLRQFEDMITIYTTTTNSITVANGLGAGQSYTFLVSAKDAAGNSSPGTKLTVTMPPSQACKVSYRIVSQWDTGFVGEITINNNRATPVNGWQLGWTYTAGQRITSVWNAQLASSPGPDVFVRQASWGPGIPANGSTTFGFVGTSTGTNPTPTALALNGVTCATG